MDKQATVLYARLMQLILYSLVVRALVIAVMNLRVPLNAGISGLAENRLASQEAPWNKKVKPSSCSMYHGG
jgi:hypothetical protein